MKKQFLVSRNFDNRLKFIKSIKGKKIAIYNYETELTKEFDVAIQMDTLMKDKVMITNLAKMDGKTSIVLIDVLVKNGVYVHPYGKIYAFTEQAKATYIIDTFAFKFTEKGIFRPFLFINPDILGHSLSEFYNEGPFKDFAKNTVEQYYLKIKPYIEIDVKPIAIEVLKYQPTKAEIKAYNDLKKELIEDVCNTKTKVISTLIKFVDGLKSKRIHFDNQPADGYLQYSNKPKNKFELYEKLRDKSIKKVYFLSSGTFGADEIELEKTMTAINRHNELIRLLNE